MASGPIRYAALERKFEVGDREEDQGDDQGKSGHHEKVNHGALQAEEVGEAYTTTPPTIRTIQRMAGNPCSASSNRSLLASASSCTRSSACS